MALKSVNFFQFKSRSEIVVPYYKDGEVAGVLDIDSAELSTFDDVDAGYLGEVMKKFGETL